MARLKVIVDRDKLTVLCAQGLTAKGIAAQLGCSPTTINFRILMWEIPYNKHPRGSKAKAPKIRKISPICEETYYKYQAGVSVQELSHEYGVSRQTVYN